MMLTVSQVTDLLGISRSKVYDLASSGKLVSYRFDGAVRFDPADVEEYKARCRVVVKPLSIVRALPQLCVSSPLGESELSKYFRKAGLQPKSTRKVSR